MFAIKGIIYKIDAYVQDEGNIWIVVRNTYKTNEVNPTFSR